MSWCEGSGMRRCLSQVARPQASSAPSSTPQTTCRTASLAPQISGVPDVVNYDKQFSFKYSNVSTVDRVVFHRLTGMPCLPHPASSRPRATPREANVGRPVGCSSAALMSTDLCCTPYTHVAKP